MIRDLDLTLKKLLTDEAEPGKELANVDISFSVPDEEWRKKGNKLELNIYLYDIRENRKLRSNEMQVERNSNGTADRVKVPPRVDCAYLVTAWNKAAAADDDDKELPEHSLLSQVLHVLLCHRTIPKEHLQGVLKGQAPALPLVSAQPGSLMEPGEFWGSLNTPVRPSISCVVTTSPDIRQSITAPMVVTKITKYRQEDKSTPWKEVIQIGGRVTDNAEPPNGIEGARVKIVEPDKNTITDSMGYYSFSNLTPGRFGFEISSAGFEDKTVQFTVPAQESGGYDVRLLKFFKVSGRVLEDKKPIKSIDGALVLIRELQKEAETGPDGDYTFLNIPQGQYTFVIKADGYKEQEVERTVPAKAPGDYTFTLTKLK
jgi:hypothetical protein